MKSIIFICIIIRLLAALWSLVLVFRLRDWRVACITLIIGAPCVRQIFALNYLTDEQISSFVLMNPVFLILISLLTVVFVYAIGRLLIDIKQKNEDLEASVQERTAQLQEINNHLRQEQKALRKLFEVLEKDRQVTASAIDPPNR